MLQEQRRAAQYVRMSMDMQQYSLANQIAAIGKYANKHGYEIVRTYSDAGKSGLVIAGREALQQLIDDIVSGCADFRFILVFDVSRWGRFQDCDESAHYEYGLARAPQFENLDERIHELDVVAVSAFASRLLGTSQIAEILNQRWPTLRSEVADAKLRLQAKYPDLLGRVSEYH